jgi:tRNA pseudouridine38-40 synthase
VSSDRDATTMRVKAKVEYLGTGFAGWQVQPDQPTVQAALENALAIVVGDRVRVSGAGRTDSGVHALGQVVSFDVPDDTDLYRLRASINGITPPDVAVVSLEAVDASFDPRRSAKSRTYRYLIVSGRPPSPLLRDRSWHVYPELDVTLLQRLAARVVGRHDFSAFRAADCESETTEREVLASAWSVSDGVYAYDVTANAFLKQMVRILVGTMVEVALGRIDEADFAGLLGGGVRTAAGPTAPARGLTLLRVDY